ncbi:DUF1365 domain-containing protein [Shimia aestuarii]|uniref:DUF1365 domain-containing protein n=1 Tax=Shimia aestuarii TaxID=254406 RepID=UPI001FB4008D|nr:DUF1365 domain-containing protein [Shimia aestuarii]
MNDWPEHLRGSTTHARRGAIGNTFRYGVDYVLIDPDANDGPLLFSRNRLNLASVLDRHHGGPVGAGRGKAWAKEVFEGVGLNADKILLLTQPRFLTYVFNPVSFWLAFRDDDLVAVIAEVNNTFGDRHSYLCHLEGFAPIRAQDQIDAKKVFHVSPFQHIEGDYQFKFDISKNRIAIRIAHINGSEGLIATLCGERARLSNARLLGASIRRPFGPLRTIALIHWQAIRLKLKGATYTRRPSPPEQEVSQ